MIHLLKEVARGKRGARDLDYGEAAEAAEAILTRRATPAQIGAFFTAERLKMESVGEMEAFVRVLRKHAFRCESLGGIDCAGPYDGRKHTFHATFPAAFVLAAAGLPVTLHGSPSLPPKRGVTLHDLLAEAGIDPAGLTPEHSLRAAAQTGVLYVPAERWCPPLGELRPIREELGFRTILNSAEKLVDYSRAPYLVLGVYHNTMFDRIARLVLRLGYRKALLVQGAEGSEDLFADRPTRVCLVENDSLRYLTMDPESWGLDVPADPPGEWTARDQLDAVEAVLRGEGELSRLHQTLLNAAVRLHLAERAGSLEEGLYISKALIDNGSAFDVYERWRRALLIRTAGERTAASW